MTDQPGGHDGTSNPPDDPRPGYSPPEYTQPPSYGQPPPDYPPPPPAYPPPGYQSPGYPPPGAGYTVPYGPYAPAPPTNTMAILALIFGIVIPPLGIIFGIIARNQIRQTGESGQGLATAGLIVGIVFTVFIVLSIIWVAIIINTVVRDLPRISDIPRFTDFPTPIPTTPR
ncbi:MAG: conserved rane protein of unknown function [Pseudonocardia sp.]|nr:conserved rane protein of unknown function [Pseudonocardia sp.]